jgi:hypothetical protein
MEDGIDDATALNAAVWISLWIAQWMWLKRPRILSYLKGILEF